MIIMSEKIQLIFRSVIMLVTLIAIPLVAIFGKQFAEIARGWWQGNFELDQWQTRPSANAKPLDQRAEPRYQPEPVANHLSLAPRFTPTPTIPVTPNKSNPAPDLLPPQSMQIAQPLTLKPNSNKLDSSVTPTVLANPIAPTTTSPLVQSEPFSIIQQRLRDLGTSYMKLELGADKSNRYRFYCEIPVAGGPSKKFFAFDTDPLKSMQQVQQQVERWQSDQQQAAILLKNNVCVANSLWKRLTGESGPAFVTIPDTYLCAVQVVENLSNGVCHYR